MGQQESPKVHEGETPSPAAAPSLHPRQRFPAQGLDHQSHLTPPAGSFLPVQLLAPSHRRRKTRAKVREGAGGPPQRAARLPQPQPARSLRSTGSSGGAGTRSAPSPDARAASYGHGISRTNSYSSISSRRFLFRDESIRSPPPAPHPGSTPRACPGQAMSYCSWPGRRA